MTAKAGGSSLLAVATLLHLAAALTACAGEDSGPQISASPVPTVSLPPTFSIEIDARVTLYGVDAQDSAGSLASGDFNGDGVTDVVFAAALADGPDNARLDSGEVYVFMGPFEPDTTRDAAAGDQVLTIYGAKAGDQLGRAVTAGDVSGDGLDDIVMGAPFGDAPRRQDSGMVYVILGSPDLARDRSSLDLATDSASSLIYGADSEDLAGFALEMADLNADEVDDLIVGALWADGPEESRSRTGEVYVSFGGSPKKEIDLAEDQQDVTVYGAAADDRLGEIVAAGDVDGDGQQDLVLPAPFADGTREDSEEAGQTYMILSPLDRVIDIAAEEQDATVLGVDGGDQLGHSIAIADVNGDGVDDILLGAVSSGGMDNRQRLAGEAMLFLGRRDWPLNVDAAAGEYDAVIYGENEEDRLGRSASAGDLNNDGHAELLIAAPGGDGPGEGESEAGEVYAFVGRSDVRRMIVLPGEPPEFVITGSDPEDVLGHESFGKPALLTADINGDTLAEILVSSPRADGPSNGRPDVGEAYILFIGINQ